jgi:hypothetical protein
MFFRHCIETFLDRTRPASSMAKPAAIHMTRKPPMRNRSVLKMKAVSAAEANSGAAAASCAMAGAAKAASAPAAISPIRSGDVCDI